MTLVDHETNSLNNFICGWYDSGSNNICEKLINFHLHSDKKFNGFSNVNESNNVHKKSIDCKLTDDNLLLQEYLIYLQNFVNKYIETYEYSDKNAPWAVVETPLVQYYSTGGGFYTWHTERTGCLKPFSDRHLVFMTYLNDVETDGETEFFYQKIKIKPKKGLTLIWPADWTFTHRGIPTQEEKYIVTGWFNYIG